MWTKADNPLTLTAPTKTRIAYMVGARSEIAYLAEETLNAGTYPIDRGYLPSSISESVSSYWREFWKEASADPVLPSPQPPSNSPTPAPTPDSSAQNRLAAAAEESVNIHRTGTAEYLKLSAQYLKDVDAKKAFDDWYKNVVDTEAAELKAYRAAMLKVLADPKPHDPAFIASQNAIAEAQLVHANSVKFAAEMNKAAADSIAGPPTFSSQPTPLEDSFSSFLQVALAVIKADPEATITQIVGQTTKISHALRNEWQSRSKN
jgi:hypothetical protein